MYVSLLFGDKYMSLTIKELKRRKKYKFKPVEKQTQPVGSFAPQAVFACALFCVFLQILIFIEFVRIDIIVRAFIIPALGTTAAADGICYPV